MNGKKYSKTVGAIVLMSVAFFVSFSSCGQPADEGTPFAMLPEVPKKNLAADGRTAVEGILFVDADTQNPLNAGAYGLQNTDGSVTPFFNYVILSRSYITMDNGYPGVRLTPALKHILDNSGKYIKPLRQKGIKVLIEIRSGNYAEPEAGISTGFGAMDVACIEEFAKDLKLLAQKYGIDGFDFNDEGGGANSYSPATRNLKQFHKNEPMYTNNTYKAATGKDLADLTASEIETVLWREGGSNFSNLIQMVNEVLKEKYTWSITNGANTPTEVPYQIIRVIMAHTKNHGNYFVNRIRDEYMPDAYSGADASVLANLRYIINNGPWNPVSAHAVLYDESPYTDTNGTPDDPSDDIKYGRENPRIIGADADNSYAPFTVDLSSPPSGAQAQAWAAEYNTDSTDRKYGAIAFKNLPPVSEFDAAGYMSIFSRELFNADVTVSGGADYKKDW